MLPHYFSPTFEAGGHLTVFSQVCTPVKRPAQRMKVTCTLQTAWDRSRICSVVRVHRLSVLYPNNVLHPANADITTNRTLGRVLKQIN